MGRNIHQKASLYTWDTKIAALPGQFQSALEDAILLSAPQAKTYSLPGKTISSQAEIDSYVTELKTELEHLLAASSSIILKYAASMSRELSIELSYKQLLATIKQQIQSTQTKAALAVSSSLIQLYWNMGKMIADSQALFEGRNNYVEQLAKDLRAEFPGMKGFSRSNLFYIRRFYQFYATASVQQAVGLNEIPTDIMQVQQPDALNYENSIQQPVGLNLNIMGVPWGHHVALLDKAKNVEEALFYLQQIIENNWSRAILTLQIEQDLYSRQGKAITNFHPTLPEKQALMAGPVFPVNTVFAIAERPDHSILVALAIRPCRFGIPPPASIFSQIRQPILTVLTAFPSAQ